MRAKENRERGGKWKRETDRFGKSGSESGREGWAGEPVLAEPSGGSDARSHYERAALEQMRHK